MAARAFAAVRRVAGQSGRLPALASCRRGGARSAHTQAEEEQNVDDRYAAAAEAFTGEQVEAALNRKNVEVLKGNERSATTVPVPDDAEAAWVPDQDTGVFVPAEEAEASTCTGSTDGAHDQPGAPSVLDQTVFIREEDMEDVERPAAGMADGDAE